MRKSSSCTRHTHKTTANLSACWNMHWVTWTRQSNASLGTFLYNKALKPKCAVHLRQRSFEITWNLLQRFALVTDTSIKCAMNQMSLISGHMWPLPSRLHRCQVSPCDRHSPFQEVWQQEFGTVWNVYIWKQRTLETIQMGTRCQEGSGKQWKIESLCEVSIKSKVLLL